MTGPSLDIRHVDPADWPALALGFADLTFEQSLGYACPAAARIGGELRLLAIKLDGTPLAAVALRLKRAPGLGRGIAWGPSGPLLRPLGRPAPTAEAIVAILAALRRQICDAEGHVLRLRLPGTALHNTGLDDTAIAAAAGFRPWTGRPPYCSAALDLSQGEDRLMQRLSGKWRTDLRFAQKSGLDLDRGFDPALQARFMTLFDAVQAAKGFRPEIAPDFHFAIPGPGCPADYALEILIATQQGRDVAGIVVGSSGATATYLFGATAEAGRPLRAGYFLTWKAVGLALARGQSWYDLGGIDAAANPDVARFKERMSGEPVAAPPFEARPQGPAGRVILGLEQLRARLKRQG